MSPLLKALYTPEKFPFTEEMKMLSQKIDALDEIISQELSFQFLNRYTDLRNQLGSLEHAARFEQGFYTCAQLFVEMLSKYSS